MIQNELIVFLKFDEKAHLAKSCQILGNKLPTFYWVYPKDDVFFYTINGDAPIDTKFSSKAAEPTNI